MFRKPQTFHTKRHRFTFQQLMNIYVLIRIAFSSTFWLYSYRCDQWTNGKKKNQNALFPNARGVSMQLDGLEEHCIGETAVGWNTFYISQLEDNSCIASLCKFVRNNVRDSLIKHITYFRCNRHHESIGTSEIYKQKMFQPTQCWGSGACWNT